MKDNFPSVVIGILIVSVFWCFFWFVTSLSAHGHDFWINQDKYKSPSAAGVLKGTHCCGEQDCYEVRKDQDFVADGDFWRFLPDTAIAQRIAEEHSGFQLGGETWPRDLTQTYMSEDARHWVCVAPIGIRCFFFSYGGF